MLIPSFSLLRLIPDGTTLELLADQISAYVAVDAQGRIYLSGVGNGSAARSDIVYRVAQTAASFEPYAGRERFGGPASSGAANAPVLHSPLGITTGPGGAVYAADYQNQRVVKIQDGYIQKVASAQGPPGAGVDSAGNLFIADFSGRLVRKVTSDGTVTTIAGGGFQPLPAVGQGAVAATSVTLRPNGLVVHPNGNTYVATMSQVSGGHEIVVRITPDGLLETVYDSRTIGGISEYHGLGLDSSGNLLIPTDPFSNSAFILQLNPDGDGVPPALGGAPSLLGTFITSVAGGPGGGIYIADSLGRVKQMSADGAFVTIYNRDLDEYLSSPADPSLPDLIGATSLAADTERNRFVSQRDLHRILEFPANSCPAGTQPAIAGVLPVPGLPRFSGTVNFAPGELISICGAGLGPSAGVGPLLDPDGLVPTTLAGVRVLFEGAPGMVLYAGAAQVNAIVPFTMYGRDQVRVQVEYNGTLSDAFPIPMRETAPSLFTAILPGTSTRDVAVINPDGSLNSPANPAPAGSIVLLYATGMGRTSPAGRDGHLAAAPLPTPLQPVTTSSPLAIIYAGTALGLVEGIIQINLQLPKAPVTGTFLLQCGDASTEFFVASK